ncbi:MAG: T9SS type A sorting domain-containing protein [Bacteroidales bacterium]|nr:T9SS type A sorting domain-containing protein [Bacteroidales bacterium]
MKQINLSIKPSIIKAIIIFVLFNLQVNIIHAASNITVTAPPTPMQGVYTVGVDTCDYLTLLTATNALKNRGISGDVTLLLADSLYTEQVSITQINGTEIGYSIFIRSFFKDRPSRIEYDATDVSDNYIIDLAGAKNVILQDIIMESKDVFYCICVNIRDTASNISLENMVLQGPAGGYSYLVNANNPKGSNLQFKNTQFIQGGAGISITGATGKDVENIVIDSCQFVENKSGFIYAAKTYFSSVTDCRFAKSSYLAPFEAIHYSNARGYTIRNNHFNMMNGTALALLYSGSNQEGYITNNIIHIKGYNGSSIDKCIEMQNGSYQHFVNNTLSIGPNSSSSSSIAFHVTNASGSLGFLTIYNNIFSNFSGGYAIAFEKNPDGITDTINNNNYYSTDSLIGLYHGNTFKSLAQWTDSTGFDSNSVFTDPLFYDTIYAVACAKEINNAGLKSKYVPIDFYHHERNTATPDIGAIEIDIPGITELQDTVTLCHGGFAELDAGNYPGASYLWSNDSTTQMIVVDAPGTYHVYINGICLYVNDSIYAKATPIPAAVIVPDSVFLCGGETETLDAGSQNDVDYLWSNAATTPTIEAHQQGWYSVVASNACGMGKDSVYIDVTPVPDIHFTDDTIILCIEDDYVVFDGGECKGSTYLWSNGSDSVETVAIEEGYYTLTITNTCGTDTDSVFVHEKICLYNAGNVKTIPFRVIPNPATEYFTIETDAGLLLDISIFNTDGKVIQNRRIDTSTKIECSSWQPGIYLLKVTTNDATYVTRVIRK